MLALRAGVIDQIMANSPLYRSNGQPLSSTNSGGSVVNGCRWYRSSCKGAKMQKTFHLVALSAMCLLAAESLAQTAALQTGPKTTSVCVLQKQVAEGEHETVRVSGLYGPGLDRTVLEDAECPRESTWVELALRSQENKEKLRKLLDSSRRAYVVVEGEFYGPPLPDPKLPEAIKKDYHPGWGHLAAFKTKLVVHAIREVKPAPSTTTP